jgi:hypothetical protein
MPSSNNKNGANSISKLALLASAAATAAFVISQTRLLERLSEPAPARPIEPPQPDALETPAEAEAPAATSASGGPPTESSQTEDDSHDDGPPPPPAGGNRLRFRAARPARERWHYGLPVSRRRSRAKEATSEPQTQDAPVAVLEAPPSPRVFDGEAFDPEYLAIVEAIAHDGYVEDEAEEETPTPPARARTSVEEMWWLPAPRMRYILAALLYVAVAAAVGSDPVTLAADGVAALLTIDSTADLVLFGWILCGVIVALPVGALAVRLVSALTRGRLHRPGFVSHDAVESAGWGLRLVATAAFIAGAVLYAPHALGWALNTDYPVAAVSSSSMSPALHEGELVLIDGVASIDDLSVGDIVAFRHNQGIAVRRITGFQDGAILANADAAPDEDMVVPFDDVAGRVLTLGGTQVKLPLLGNISLLGERTVDPTAASTRLPQ